jgi:hypothetical protein
LDTAWTVDRNHKYIFSLMKKDNNLESKKPNHERTGSGVHIGKQTYAGDNLESKKPNHERTGSGVHIGKQTKF